MDGILDRRELLSDDMTFKNVITRYSMSKQKKQVLFNDRCYGVLPSWNGTRR